MRHIDNPRHDVTAATRRTSRRMRSRRAFSAVELLTAFGVITSVLSVILSLTWQSVRALDRQQLQTRQGNNARTGIDEFLAQLRYADTVLIAQSISGTSYSTGDTSIVIKAPGYNTATSAVFLAGVSDYVAFRYDASTKRLLESCLPGTGSMRPSRSDLPIAEGVNSLSLTYRAREVLAPSVGSFVYTLKVNATSQPTVLIDGVASTGIWTSLAPNKITIVAPTAKSNIQVAYTVNPTASSGAALQYVKQVDVVVGFSDIDSRNVIRTLNMAGSARLRNQRL